MQIGKINQMHIAIILGKAQEGSWGEYSLPSDQELLQEYKGAYANLAVYETLQMEAMEQEILELKERVENFAIKPETEKLLRELAEMYKERKE